MCKNTIANTSEVFSLALNTTSNFCVIAGTVDNGAVANANVSGQVLNVMCTKANQWNYIFIVSR